MILTGPCRPGGTLHGMTVSSAASLLVHPTPLLQFNLHLPLYTRDALVEDGVFAVHMMPPTHRLVELARLFSNGVKRNEATNQFEPTRPFDLLVEGVDWEARSGGVLPTDVSVPVLLHAERAMLCKTHKVFAVGDHEIWVGEVVGVETHPLEGGRGAGGLLFHDRGFHIVGDRLVEPGK